MSTLIEDPEAAALAAADLRSLGLINAELADRAAKTFRIWRHGTPDPRHNIERPPGQRQLVVTGILEHYPLEEAHERFFGIRDWRHIVVSIQGQNAARLAEQNRLGRPLEPGERSRVPLPDWYELAHLAYEHAEEIGLDPDRPTYQYLPGREEERINFSEALHLRQPK